MAKKTTKRVNPYVKHFLHKHPLWSAAQARAGEESWDAALNQVLKILPHYLKGLFLRRITALKSTRQRGY